MPSSSESQRLSYLSALGDPLDKVSQSIDFDFFRPVLNEVFLKKEKGVGGRPSWDAVLMFKILLLQSWYGLSDDKIEYLINDRLSFQRFLGLSLDDKVPDSKTVWLFKNTLSKNGAYEDLFSLFTGQMEAQGVITRTGSIVDASFVDVPRQRNTREENKVIKAGGVPEEWKKPENVNMLKQKDVEAHWAKKNNETHYGYKDHVKVDSDSKMIVEFEVTTASVHDSKAIVDLCDKKDKVVYADSAYVGVDLERELKEKCGEDVDLRIHEKGYRNKPLTEEQKKSNREKSRVRVRVEHVFGHITNSMGGMIIRSIGLARARCAIAFKNLAYNLSRYAYLSSVKKELIGVGP